MRTALSSSVVIVTHHHGPRVVLRLHGELDVSNQDALRRTLGAILKHDPQTLEVDVSGLGFADCSILSVLVWAHKRLADHHHELIITGAQPMVRRLFAITGLDTFFRLSEPRRTSRSGLILKTPPETNKEPNTQNDATKEKERSKKRPKN